MFSELNVNELKELKRALNTMIETRVTFNTTDAGVKQDNASLLAVDYKLLKMVIDEIEIRKNGEV